MFGAACDGYLSRKAWVGYSTVGYVSKWKRTWGDVPVAEIDAEAVGDWLDTRLSEVTQSTARRELNVLSAILHHAHARGWIDAVPRIERPADGEPRLRWLDKGEAMQLLVECRAPVLQLTMFLLHTGARLGEAVALEWSDVDPEWEHVVLQSRKGRGARVRRRIVPLNSDARVSLMFLHDLGLKRPFPYASSQAAAWGITEAAKRAKLGDFQVHDLRRTFATRLLTKGVNPRVVADLLGHSGLAMVMRYMQAPEDVKVDAVRAIQGGGMAA